MRAITNSQRIRLSAVIISSTSVGEILLLGIAGRSTVCQARARPVLPPPARFARFPPGMRRRVREGALGSDAVDANRASDVLQALLTDISKAAIEPSLDLVVYDARDADPFRLGDPLQPRGDVYAVAGNVAVFDDHISQINARAELDAVLLGDGIVADGHLLLHRDGRRRL